MWTKHQSWCSLNHKIYALKSFRFFEPLFPYRLRLGYDPAVSWHCWRDVINMMEWDLDSWCNNVMTSPKVGEMETMNIVASTVGCLVGFMVILILETLISVWFKVKSVCSYLLLGICQYPLSTVSFWNRLWLGDHCSNIIFGLFISRISNIATYRAANTGNEWIQASFIGHTVESEVVSIA